MPNEGEGGPLIQGDIEALGYQSDTPDGVPPDSPPGEGVSEDAPRPGEPAPEKLADGSDADKPVPYDRFREVNERAQMYEQMWGAMGLPNPSTPEFLEWASSQGAAQQAPETPTEPAAAPQADPEDDTSAWLRQEVRASLRDELAPLGEIKEFISAQKASANRSELRRQVESLKQTHPEFNEVTDMPALASVVKKMGLDNLEAAYRVAFWDRRGSAATREAPQAGDLSGAPATASAGSSEDELFKRMMESGEDFDREQAAEAYLNRWIDKKGGYKAFGL